jgi:hypothetical protein
MLIVTDCHAKAIPFRWFDAASGADRTFNRATMRSC